MSQIDEKEKNFAEPPKNCPMCGSSGKCFNEAWSFVHDAYLFMYMCTNVSCLHVYVKSTKKEIVNDTTNDQH